MCIPNAEAEFPQLAYLLRSILDALIVAAASSCLAVPFVLSSLVTFNLMLQENYMSLGRVVASIT